MTVEGVRRLVSGVLALGVSVATALIALGMIGSVVVGWQGSFTGAEAAVGSTTDFTLLPASLLELRPIGIAQLGLVVLLATPVLRVSISLAAFAVERDKLYTAITLVILVVLLTSLLLLR